ncbi:MAG: PH domain-containing protein [Luminiphilus sp.]|nr:PH domain-containing protein [Luminiphilus sp.]MBL6820510.1 PH domain-containing protein [Luminiphilus sp.]
MGMTEYEDEPVEGLPERLPDGETMVWQGRPTVAAMAKRVFYIPHLALYFGLLIAGHTVYRLMEGVSAAQVMGTFVWQAGLAVFVLVLLAWLARAYARSILYTLTSERLVIRSGVALPMMANIPIEQIIAADMRVYRDGTGDILLKPVADRKLYWVLLWPNVSAWYSRPVRPLLRGLPDLQRAADAFASVASQHYKVTSGEQTAVPVRVHTGGNPLPVG